MYCNDIILFNNKNIINDYLEHFKNNLTNALNKLIN